MRKLRVPAGDERIVHGGAGKRESLARLESVIKGRTGQAFGLAGMPDTAVERASARRGLERPCAVIGFSCIDSGKVIGLTTR